MLAGAHGKLGERATHKPAELLGLASVIRRPMRKGANDRYSGGMTTLAAPDSMRFLSSQML